MYTPATYWHDSYQAVTETVRRLCTPLHYHLRRRDYVSLKLELKSGANPFILDECGRTVLDLALLIMEELLVAAFCTTFPIDSLVDTFDYDARHPAKFCCDYAECYSGMYDHLNVWRLRQGRSHCSNKISYTPYSLGDLPRFSPVAFPSYQHETLPRQFMLMWQRKLQNAFIRSIAMDFKHPRETTALHESTNQKKLSTKYEDNIKLKEYITKHQEESPVPCYALNSTNQHTKTSRKYFPDPTTLEQSFHEQVLMVAEDTFRKSIPFKIKRRMSHILSELEGLTHIINLMTTNPDLHSQAIQFRLIVSQHHKSLDQGDPDVSVPVFILEYFTYPYLFMVVVEMLFELYPYRTGNVLLDPRNPIDCRYLVGLVTRKKLKGHEIVSFLKNASEFLEFHIFIMGETGFQPDPDLGQILLYMAFSLDVPFLFYLVSKSCNLFQSRLTYDWNATIRCLLTCKERLKSFLIPLMTAKLKNALSCRKTPNTTSNVRKESPTGFDDPESPTNDLPKACTSEDFFNVFQEIFNKDEDDLDQLHQWWATQRNLLHQDRTGLHSRPTKTIRKNKRDHHQFL